MKIELKNVKHAQFASQETNCFNASVWIDGKKVGTAENDGRGGETLVCLDNNGDWDAINTYIKTLPVIVSSIKSDDTESGFFEYDDSIESIIDELLTDWLITRDCKKLVSKRLVFTKKGEKGIFQSRCLPKAQMDRYKADTSLLAKQTVEWDVDQWLTFLPLQEAVAVYKSASFKAF